MQNTESEVPVNQYETYDSDLFEIVGCDTEDSDKVVRKSMTYGQDAWRRLRKNKVAIASLFTIVLIILLCFLVPVITGVDFAAQDVTLEGPHQGPSAAHWFGTDELGRDTFTRLWIGGRVSMIIGIVGTVVSLIVGVIYGGISGYVGGRLDNLMMRIVEILCSVPYLIVVILVSMVLGKGMLSLIIALCLTSWTGLARIVRGQVMQLKENEYVLAARALGARPWRVVMKHLIPNTMSVIIVDLTFKVPGFIFSEAFLSFLGMGIQPPSTSWGAMAAAAQQQMNYYPMELVYPALAISITMLAFNLLGDGLRDALDPKLRQ